jgi:hypothetical protein
MLLQLTMHHAQSVRCVQFKYMSWRKHLAADPHNKRIQMDRPKRCALVSATDAGRYVYL